MKMLFYDLEVSRDIVEGYGNKYDFKVVKTLRHQELMCVAYKWLGDKKVQYKSRHDFETYTEFVQFLADLQDAADVVVAHNANKFDNRMTNRFLVKEGILPPSPFKTIDTLRVARSKFKFQSNSLNDLASFLGLGNKETITYADLEDDFMTDNPSRRTLRLMKKYTVKDVELLEKIYLVFRPWISNHPNVGDIDQVNGVCPKCGSPDVVPYGSHARRNGRVKAYRCNSCGGRCNENTLKGEGRLVNAM